MHKRRQQERKEQRIYETPRKQNGNSKPLLINNHIKYKWTKSPFKIWIKK